MLVYQRVNHGKTWQTHRNCNWSMGMINDKPRSCGAFNFWQTCLGATEQQHQQARALSKMLGIPKTLPHQWKMCTFLVLTTYTCPHLDRKKNIFVRHPRHHVHPHSSCHPCQSHHRQRRNFCHLLSSWSESSRHPHLSTPLLYSLVNMTEAFDSLKLPLARILHVSCNHALALTSP